ncbi:MAG: heat-inducible transcriptional repressor HrcA [Candidatus Margulisbacteria bacterium]|nr:heat-inducible transcriptional repressor HrcA [Candidatus Margulisiibacteriota bacterium]MBU1021443.1 heat-inducible transcriptional repressor HrcA [Candidatus Margulisiibacteriota bacterium]MBU1728364.1 heat-inducible transcriptional repressor HrcA [Candidatus Margulisiibacteriota bacterium]MBU1955893.1 heat-inducible transcriptional repressor HrcA [Candidatus Margulisiibacteriota bacterium]
MPKNLVLDERKQQIFAAIVEDYLNTAEPVGSRTIWKSHIHNLSPATIRNEMADLEEEGLISHPHTSAGRIPTDKGYRYYVDNLLKAKPLPKKDAEIIKHNIKRFHRDVEEILHETTKLVSSLCAYTAVAIMPPTHKSAIKMFTTGISKLLELPEFNNTRQIRPLLEMLDHEEILAKILGKYIQNREVTIKIGHENKSSEMQNVSIVIKACGTENQILGGIGVIGPTRMTYGKVTQVIDSVSREIEQLSLF